MAKRRGDHAPRRRPSGDQADAQARAGGIAQVDEANRRAFPRSTIPCQRWNACSEKKHGITMKLERGTFTATFFLACLAAMELEGVGLEEL
jgi:hypothetical protein